MVVAINLFITPDCDGDYQLSVEYENGKERFYIRKTLKGALNLAYSLQEKSGSCVNLIKL